MLGWMILATAACVYLIHLRNTEIAEKRKSSVNQFSMKLSPINDSGPLSDGEVSPLIVSLLYFVFFLHIIKIDVLITLFYLNNELNIKFDCSLTFIFFSL